MRKIVLSIPHASLDGVFHNFVGKWPRTADFVNNCLLKHTDLFVDMLFLSQEADNRIVDVKAKYSRLVCDVNEADGSYCEQFGEFKRGELSDKAKHYINTHIRGSYFQSRLASSIDDDGETMLINCESFNSELGGDTDICIGFNDDFTHDGKIVDTIRETFEAYGYKVSLNEPYKGAIVPTTLKNYKSVTIAVNKRVYMDEGTMKLLPNDEVLDKWFKCIREMYSKLLDEV